MAATPPLDLPLSKRLLPPQLLLIAAALFWAGNTVTARGFGGAIPPVSLSFWRWVIAFLVLLPFTAPELVRCWPLFRRHWRMLLLYAALGTAGCNVMGYLALQYTTAINAALINSATPVYVMLLSLLLYGERIGRAQAVGVGVSTLGVLAILSGGSVAALAAFAVNVGDLMMIVSCGMWAAYTALLRKKPAALPAMGFVTVLMGLSALMLLPFYMVELSLAPPMRATWPNLAALAYVGLLPTLGLVFWNRGVAEIGANRASPFMHLMPVFTSLLAVAFLGERFGWHHGAGIAAILGGVWLASRR